MNVFLVEPNYNSKYAPLGLMKISSMLKRQGHTVKFVKGRKLINENFDEIYITTLFTFWYKQTIETILFYKYYYKNADIKIGGIFASLMPDYIKKHTGLTPHYGLIPEAEKEIPDYGLVNSDTSICFTPRGCMRRCKFCIVPKVEGKMQNIENWQEQIDVTKPKITFWDNNWFAKGYDKVVEDIGIIKGLLKRGVTEFDFNQGLDARLFNEDFAKAMSGLPIKPVRFAFDNMTEDGYVQRGIELCQKYGISRMQKWKATGKPVTIYVLYNFMDKPEDFYYRIREIVRLGGMPYPMQFSPHEDLKREYIGKYWNRTQRDAVKKLTDNLGQISSDSQKVFETIWGANEDEFLGRISFTKEEIKHLKTKKRIDNIRTKMNYQTI